MDRVVFSARETEPMDVSEMLGAAALPSTRLLPGSVDAPDAEHEMGPVKGIEASSEEERAGLRRGDILKGKYEILALIGKGGMSRVYLARDLELANKQWAVKEVDRHATDALGRPIEQSLASEAELLSKLQHPSIVSIVDIEKTDRFIYVVMDHIEGEPLEKVVRRCGPQREEDVQAWMLQLCDALSYLHRQDPPVIHRDMKPSNIMLHPDGYVKLIDLGVAREYKDEQRKDTVAFGTTGYAAPEQYGKAQTDARTDIYGLGVTMWHLLGGTPPPVEFPLPDVRTENPAVGEGFAEAIIPRCTELKREERYQTCEELAADIAIHQELTRDHRARQRRRVMAFAAAVLAAASFALMGCTAAATREARIAESFEQHMDIANAAVQTDPISAQDEYLAAIAQVPDAVDAYEGLIASYKVDGRFTTQEKAQFDKVYNANLAQLKSAERASELSYELGRLYWYFYDYGQTGAYEDNQVTRIKASTEHFVSASRDETFEHQATAQDYADIASFVSGIDAAVMQGDESDELYAGFWESLQGLVDRLAAEQMEMVKLDGCLFAADSIETYMGKFKGIANVSQASMEGLLDAVQSCLVDMDATTEANQHLRASALARMEEEVRPKLAALYAEPMAGEGR